MTPLTAQNAFERAQERYKESLTAKELTRLDAPTNIDSLLSQAKSISETLQTQRKRKSNQFVSGISKVAIKLQPFEKLLQGACNMSPKGGELLWGSVLFILEMAKNNVSVFDEVLGFFLDMAHEIEYVKTVEDTFSTAPLVVGVVESLYVAIIGFWVEALRYYRRTLKKGVLSGIMSVLSSNDMNQRFRELKKDIATQKAKLLEATVAQHHADYVSHRHESEEQLHTARQGELIKQINAPFYERDLAAADKHRYEGTCEWVRNRSEYARWTDQADMPLLVIYGIPGAGKTILSSWLINQARSSLAEHVVFYHYFKEGDDGKNTPLAATRSFFHQLYEYLRRTKHRLLSRFESEVGSVWEERYVDFERLWSLFSAFISEISPSPQDSENPSIVTIVLDAMDECKGPKPIVRALKKLVDHMSDKVKVVITSRRSGGLVEEFESLHPNKQSRTLFLDITADDLKHDIASFTYFKISKIERLRGEERSRLREKIIGVLSSVENHQGMFLWTYLMCKQIKYQLDTAAIWRLLDNLPKGLDAVYAHICKRLAKNDDQNREFGRLVLQWLVIATRPLNFAELEDVLKTMQAQNIARPVQKPELFDDDESFSQDYGNGLLWSRKDIVKSCGDLVTYTGLNEGDQIRLIHLSAKQFFSTHPSQLSLSSDIRPTVETYLISVPHAEIIAGTTCLEYLLSPTLHSDRSLQTAIGLKKLDTDCDSFKARFPFFNYTTLYWPEHVFNAIKTQGENRDVQNLMAKVVTLTAHPVFAKWLEVYIFLTDTEYALYTIRRFSDLDPTFLPIEITHWATNISRVLSDFTATLSNLPQMVGVCFHQSLFRHKTAEGNNPETGGDEFPLVEASQRTWIYYDDSTDALFSFDIIFDVPCLKCQIIKTGQRMRPMLGARPGPRTSQYRFSTAVVSTRRDLIAMTYQEDYSQSTQYHTICWKIGKLSSINDWARIVFVSHTDYQRGIFEYSPVGRGGLIAFREEETLMTPSGVWDIQNKELIDRPLAIYEPDTNLKVDKTFFSGNGERLARLLTGPEGETIEILDNKGVLVLQQNLGQRKSTGSLFPQVDFFYFSHTGAKLVIQQQALVLWCLIVDDAKKIEMPTTQTLRPELRFTSDEEKVLASTVGVVMNDGTENISGSMLGVWSFTRNDNGDYTGSADLIYVFKNWDNSFTFSLISGHDIMIVDGVGVVNRRPIDKEWSISEDLKLRSHQENFGSYLGSAITINNGYSELVICASDHNLKVRRWSLEKAGPRLISTDHSRGVVASEQKYDLQFCLSPRCRYIVADNQVFETDGLPAYAFDLPSTVQGRVATTFSTDEMYFACAYGEGDIDIVLAVFDIIPDDLRIAPRASITVHDVREDLLFSVAFIYDNSNFLAITSMDRTHVFEMQDKVLVPVTIDERLKPFRITYSDEYLYYGPAHPTRRRWPELKANLDTNSKVSLTHDFIPPTSITFGSYYVCLPHILMLRRYWSTGVILLDHKYIDQDDTSHASRVICVVPDTLIGRLSEMEVMLVWPEKSDSNLMLAIVANGFPTTIDTGIKSSELMVEEQWFQTENVITI